MDMINEHSDIITWEKVCKAYENMVFISINATLCL